MSAELADRFIKELEVSSGITSLLDAPPKVEVVHREKDGKRYIFILNHTDKVQKLNIPANWQPFDDRCSDTIEPHGTMVYIA